MTGRPPFSERKRFSQTSPRELQGSQDSVRLRHFLACTLARSSCQGGRFGNKGCACEVLGVVGCESCGWKTETGAHGAVQSF